MVRLDLQDWLAKGAEKGYVLCAQGDAKAHLGAQGAEGQDAEPSSA